MAASSCGITIADALDPNLPLIYVNEAFEQITGYPVPEVVGRNCRFLQRDDRDQPGLTVLRAALKRGENSTIVLRNYRKDGSMFWNELFTSPILDAGGRLTHFVGIQTNITTRKTAEEQNRQLLLQLEAANQELKDFAYVISHDLRAPLRGVSSIAHWLITRYGSVFDKDGQELIDLLGGRVRRMEQMINGVLEYSRIGRDKATLSQVDLATVIPQIVLDIVPTDRMTVLIEGDLPTVNVEATRIRQVFQNLIDNAVKFMDKPQGEIQIGCLPDEALWCFYVRDNGCGIPAEHFDRIFQLFQTLQPKDQQESTGVGLALTKRIIEQYGGKIWVKSTVSVGTTFFFTLPRGAQTDQSSG